MSVTQDKINAIKTAIWGKLNSAEPMSGDDIPSKIDDVYDAGKQEMMDAFWKSITNNNTKTEYSRAFKNWYIDTAVFKPTATLNCGGTSNELFYNATSTDGLDMQALEEELGYPILDTSQAINLSYAFFSPVVTTLGVIDLSSCTNTNRMLYNPDFYKYRVKSIKKLIVSRTTDFDYAFHYATGLEHCIFEGTMAYNGLNMQHCTKLDKESITSIINCTWNSDSSTWGYTITLSLNAVATAFETEPGAYNGHLSEEWTSLVQQAGNWTINLV